MQKEVEKYFQKKKNKMSKGGKKIRNRYAMFIKQRRDETNQNSIFTFRKKFLIGFEEA